MIYKIVFLYILSFPIILNAQTSDFNWLVGKWKMESTKSEVYEEWHKKGDRLIGKSYSIIDGKEKISESLFLEKFNEQWAYIALPNGQFIALFALVETADNEFIFENKEHDFPTRIIYGYDGSDSIDVTVEGESKGQTKAFSFKLIRVK